MSEGMETAENARRISMLTVSKCAKLDLMGDDDDDDDFLKPRAKPEAPKAKTTPEKKDKKKRGKHKHKGKGRRRHKSKTSEEPKAEAPQTGTGPRVNTAVMEEVEDDPLRKGSGLTDEGAGVPVPPPARVNICKVCVHDYEESDSSYDSSDYSDDSEEENDDTKALDKAQTRELERIGLTKSQTARVEAHAHAMAEYVIVDTSFLATPAFDVFLSMRGVWWGPGTDRTLVVPSCTFQELEMILQGKLSPDGMSIPHLAIVYNNLSLLMEKNELIRLDVDDVMMQIYEAYEIPTRLLLATTFKMACVLMERRIELCPVPCLLSVLMRDPVFRVALSTFGNDAIKAGTIKQRWLYEKEPCWCPVQVRDGTCPGGACPYVHREDPESLVRDAHPQCPRETLGYICEDKACPWRHVKRAAPAAPAIPAAPVAPAAPAAPVEEKPAETGAKKPSYLKDKPAGHRRNASVIVMKMPSYLSKKGPKPEAASTEAPKKPPVDLLKPTVTQIVTGKNAVLEMSRLKAEARAMENAQHFANYCSLIEGLSKMRIREMPAKKDEVVVTEGCDEHEWDDY